VQLDALVNRRVHNSAVFGNWPPSGAEREYKWILKILDSTDAGPLRSL
jgi:hypothetical protein